MKQLIWYPKCTTCKKADEALKACGLQYSYRDIKEEKLNEEELKQLIVKSKLSARKFFNTSGLKYRELNLKEKLDAMSEEEMIELLATDGMLVKRPLFVTEDTVIVGKKGKEYALLKKD